MGRSRAKTGRSEEANLEHKIDAANTMKLEESLLGNLLAKGSSSGEVVGKEDLWKCLFRGRPGHTQYSPEAEGAVARQLGGTAAEARLNLDGQSWNSV